MQLFEEARERFRNHSAKIAIIGLGYAGLPLACTFAEAGFRVIGFDIDARKVQEISAGRSYIAHIDSERINRLGASAKLTATSDFSLLSTCDAAIICVPTPLAEGRVPDQHYVIDTTRAVQSYLRRGQLVVLESTTYPGTTDEVLLPILAESGKAFPPRRPFRFESTRWGFVSHLRNMIRQ
jgi:UDP-N-acetyl-D-glucosamine dehydrogenase